VRLRRGNNGDLLCGDWAGDGVVMTINQQQFGFDADMLARLLKGLSS
jgi:hypothetical protein